jgi:hypothetical protein
MLALGQEWNLILTDLTLQDHFRSEVGARTSVTGASHSKSLEAH